MGKTTEDGFNGPPPEEYNGVTVPLSIQGRWDTALGLGWRLGVIDAHMAKTAVEDTNAVRQLATGILPYQCGVCPWRFSSRKYLDRHIYDKHGVDRG
jgi:hypothetical protein